MAIVYKPKAKSIGSERKSNLVLPVGLFGLGYVEVLLAKHVSFHKASRKSAVRSK